MSEATSSANTESSIENSERTLGKRLRDLLLGTTLVEFIARMTLIPVLIYLGIFLAGFALAWFYPEGSAGRFAYIRSLLEIILAISMILIFIAFGVLIIQIARFVNLLRSEVKPITEDTKQAVKNVRATTEFVQKNAVAPVISFSSFVAGLVAFLRELSAISKILQKRDQASDDETELSEE